MKFIGMFLKLIGSVIKTAVILAICSSILFVAYKGNQPMQVPHAPKGMTYFDFIADRIDAAKTVEPSRCGWGMMLSLVALGPIYSFVYTEVGIHPDGFLARGTASDPDIPKDVADAKWYDVPGIWWNTVEKLSWTMVGKPAAYGCKFRRVNNYHLFNNNTCQFSFGRYCLLFYSCCPLICFTLFSLFLSLH